MKKLFFLAIFLIYGLGYAQQIWTEGFEGAAFPPTGWSMLDISGVKIWEKETVTTHTGNGAAMHDFAAASFGLQETALVSPPITLPNYGTPTLDFWSRLQLVGYQYSGILISTTVNNDINAFTEVKVLSGSEIELGVWKNITIPLTAYIGETIYIAFLYKNTDGHRWFIDDIAITHFEGFVDIQAVSMTPATGTYPRLAENEQITVRLKNNGGDVASGIILKLFHDDNLMATETFTETIPSLEEATYTFTTTLNLSAATTHKIQVVAELSGDQVPTNNTVTAMVTNLGCEVITAFPFAEGFENHGENMPPCWTQEVVAGVVNWRTIASSTFIPNMRPVEAFEGDHRAVFYVGGYGHVNKLVTPPMDLTLLGNPVLKFHHIQQRWDDDQDSLKVYYRTSTQSAWKLLEKYTGEVFDWTERVIPLPEPSNEYYIAFEGYHNYARSVQIDNVLVGDYYETDIAVKAIAPEGTQLELSDNQEITATIKNNGRSPVSGFNLSLYINENFIATETFSDASGIFKSYEKAFKDALEHFEDEKYCIVRKVYIESDKYFQAEISKSGEIMDISGSYTDDIVKKNENFYPLLSVYIDVPVPFKRGDLVEEDNDGWMGDVYVLQKICRDDFEYNSKAIYHYDLTDMNAGVHCEVGGLVRCEDLYFYPDLRYCRRELKGKQRILKYVSLHLQDKLCLCSLLKIQKYLWADEIRSELKNDGDLEYQLEEIKDKLLSEHE